MIIPRRDPRKVLVSKLQVIIRTVLADSSPVVWRHVRHHTYANMRKLTIESDDFPRGIRCPRILAELAFGRFINVITKMDLEV